MLQSGYADTLGLILELQGEVWDQFPYRRQADSPHRELSDIWVRYNPIENFENGRFNEEHVSEWYPIVQQIPEAKRLSERIAADYGQKLGGVLITKIPAHKQCYPHIDRGWHAEAHDKLALQVKGNQAQRFHVEGEELTTLDGDLFTFDNSKLHWVTNLSDEDRITMIVCLRKH